MLIRIDAAPVGPLEVLRELPDAPLAILEGLNGIGKSLAVRLLQLCTGTMPYSRVAPSWRSLCEGLGEFEVTITGLRGASELHWVADSRRWLDQGDEGYPQFEEITVDGRNASIEEIRRVLVVHRVGGDEGIVETLAQQADAAAEDLRRWSRSRTSEQNSPLASLEDGVNTALHLVGEWPLEKYRLLEAALAKSEERWEVARARAASARDRRDAIAEAVRLQRLYEEVLRRTPGLETRVRRIDEQIVVVAAERDDLQHAILSLAGRLAAAEPVVRELRNATRTLERNQGKLAVAMNDAAAAAVRAGTEPTRADVEAALAAQRDEVEALLVQQAAMDSAPAMRSLLDDMTAELSSAELSGLSDQIAIDEPETGVQLSVSQTKAGVVSRRAHLEGQPPPPQALEVAGQLAQAKDRLARLVHARDCLSEVERLRQRVRDNEARVDRAVENTDAASAADLGALEERRREADQTLLDLAAERAAIHQQLGVLGDADAGEGIEDRFRRSLAAAEVPEDRLAVELAEAEAESARSVAFARETEEALRLARHDLARATADVRRAVTALSVAPELGWIREALDHVDMPMESDAFERQLEAVSAVSARLEHVAERLGAHRTQVAAVYTALVGVARRLRGLDPQAVEYVVELQAWFGQRFSEWFNNPRVRAELLPEADGDVSVNLNERQVEWTQAGAPRTRPLEAFSSGEQAFAYTRAQLGSLDDDLRRPQNRLIVLDEFGAFMAHDRLGRLMSYLRERADQHPEDQVLVVVPLNRDYASMAETAIGSEADRLLSMAAEVRDRKYAVQAFSS